MPIAQYNVGMMYYKGERSVSPNLDEARKYLELAAKNKGMRAQLKRWLIFLKPPPNLTNNQKENKMTDYINEFEKGYEAFKKGNCP